MKTNKTFAILAAISLAVGFVLACNKESSTSVASDGNPSLKVAGYNPNYLEHKLTKFWMHCRRAYDQYDTAFINTCLRDDTTNFLALANISSQLMDTIRYQLDLRFLDYLDTHSNIPFDTTVCTSCLSDALIIFGRNIDDYFYLVKQIKILDPTYSDTVPDLLTPMTECQFKCHQIGDLSPVKYILCIENCELNKEIDFKEKELIALKQVAGGDPSYNN